MAAAWREAAGIGALQVSQSEQGGDGRRRATSEATADSDWP